MSEAERLAELIRQLLPNVHSGALCVFGDWFGRPHDNVHSIVGADAEAETLAISFDQGEVLTVIEPSDATITATEFRIGRADRVRWEWFYYGRPHTPENRYSIEHRVAGERVIASSDADWHEFRFRPSLSRPAVELD